ncbi:ABC transporter substrate-binding protein [Solihabitans fulvus]|uniref:ABC transporter substrate-binding protein n=1 Tax=Solihabitans fulvus TaxID=1892852 RepID=A0A5B2X2Q6_9PSEU|nr:ABC transporter substrate-binding protein [Solihabitans fulvus]KAA2257556.1 ABC transporter substrate-binding protein [Solihabitans fulvus]
MPEKPDTAVALTHRALGIRESDPERARELLGVALALDEEYEPAWRWLAELVDDAGARLFCLDRAYAIKAEPATARARRALGRVTPRPPAEVADLIEPERPAADSGAGAGRTTRRRWIWPVAGAAVVAMCVLLGAVAGFGSTRVEPVYVALVAGMSGDNALASSHMERAVRMHLDSVNAAGGIVGHPVELLVYDDESRADKAVAIAKDIVRDNKVLYVVGHGTSDTALAAAPIYQQAKIPAITPSASSARITDGSGWYFRSMFGNRTQSDFLSVYASRVLGSTTAAVVYDEDEDGRSAHETFRESFGAFGRVTADLPIAAEPGRTAASVDAAVEALRTHSPTAPIVLALKEKTGLAVIDGLRSAGVTAPVLGTSALSSIAFHDSLLRAEADRKRPGSLTANLFMGTPMAQDSLSGPAQIWADAYEHRYGERPLWQAATARQAVKVGLHAMEIGGLGFDGLHRAEDRQRVRDALASLKDRKNAFPALLGPLYFNANGSAQMAVSMVTSDGVRFVSAPVQFTIYEPPSGDALKDGLAKGSVIAVAGRYLSRRQVVGTGINLNEIRDLDTTTGTYFVDFFVWLKYSGDDVAADVQFVNAVKPDLKLGEPLRNVTENGHTYRLYRVADRFKGSLEFRDFPFDRQRLTVLLQNRTQTADQVSYVTDKEILDQDPSEYLRSGADADADINRIPNWIASSVHFFRQTVGSSDALGDGKATGTATGIYYSQYAGEIEIQRDVLPFLIKNLLPLVLLVCVAYLTLFFRASDSGAPVSMGVTAILSTAVLLNNVTSQLPSVSYIVALEWGYYAFILLAAMCVLVAMLRKRFASTKRDAAERALSRAARIGYPAFLLAVVAVFVVAYG